MDFFANSQEMELTRSLLPTSYNESFSICHETQSIEKNDAILSKKANFKAPRAIELRAIELIMAKEQHLPLYASMTTFGSILLLLIAWVFYGTHAK